MDWRLVTRQGVDVTYEKPSTMSRGRCRCRTLMTSEKTTVLCYKTLDDPSAGASPSPRLDSVSRSAYPAQSRHSSLLTGDLTLMASACCLPIADGYPYGYIGFKCLEFGNPHPWFMPLVWWEIKDVATTLWTAAPNGAQPGRGGEQHRRQECAGRLLHALEWIELMS